MIADMTSAFGFADAVARIEAALAASLGLIAAPLRHGLADATGTWKGDPVRIVSTAWTGPAVRFARFVRVSSNALDIGNLLVMPRPPSAAPIFGADLVAARSDAGLVAADLSPVAAPPPAAADAKLPEWTAGIFSASPIFVRVGPADAAQAVKEVEALADTFSNAVRRGAPVLPPFIVEAAHQRYLAAHRRDEKMATMLGHIFGASWTAEFIDAVLFPAAS